MGRCSRLTLKKYLDRPSPPYHAGDCKEKTLKGNDNKLYKSVPDKRGIYTWKLVSSSKNTTRKKLKGRKYVTHDNYSRPFIVYIDQSSKIADIFKQHYDSEKDQYKESEHVKTVKFKEVWLGSDPKEFGTWFDLNEIRGNSILLELANNEYMYIGEEIYTFKLLPGDSPGHYYSPIGNNDVPYPYLIGKTHTYFLLGKQIVPNEWLDLTREAYGQLYGHTPGPKGSVKSVTKSLKTKLVHKRIYV
jgi:hypothetical protein